MDGKIFPKVFLTHCTLVDSSTVISEKSICNFRGVGIFYRFCSIFFWKILLANNVNPDETPHCMASDLGLHCVPMTLLRVST